MNRLRILAFVLGVASLAGCDVGSEHSATAQSDSQNDPKETASTSPNPQNSSAQPLAPSTDGHNEPTKTHEDPPRPRKDLPQPVALADDDWPQFRGQQRDGQSRATGLLRSWPESGPNVLWETAVGQGYASPSVVAGRVYLNDYDEETDTWMVRCLSLETGDEFWRYDVKKRIRPNHAITRSAPATDGGFVIAIDPKCELHCLDARDGSLIWKKFLPAEYGGQIPAWYNGQCPLLDDGRLIIAPGGRALLTALDNASGAPIWETPNEDNWTLSHSSVMPVEIDGVKQYATTMMQGLIGVNAESGKLLWRFPWKFNTAVATTPLPLGDGKFLLTSGYHAQSVICQVKRNGEAWTADEAVRLPIPTRGWNSEVHTPLVYRGAIFGVGKKKRGLWTCLDLEGKELWTSERKASFGMGGYVLADGMFFVLEGKTGTLRVLDAEADQYRELASAKLLKGPDVWAPPIISQRKLLIRDLGKLICLDIAADQDGANNRTPVTSTTRTPSEPDATQ